MNALGQAELASRENEEGQRDDIHAQGSSLRASRHQIPSGRSPELKSDDPREEKTPKAASHHQPREGSRSRSSERGEPKAKAFAFYGMVRQLYLVSLTSRTTLAQTTAIVPSEIT